MSFENAEFCVAHLRSRSGTLRLGSGAPRVVSFGFGGASGGSGTDLEGSLRHLGEAQLFVGRQFRFPGRIGWCWHGPDGALLQRQGAGCRGPYRVRLEGGLPVPRIHAPGVVAPWLGNRGVKTGSPSN